jgi:hypothetical protein
MNFFLFLANQFQTFLLPLKNKHFDVELKRVKVKLFFVWFHSKSDTLF